MKKTSMAIALLLLGSPSMGAAHEPLCANSFDAMPASWRPSAEVRKGLKDGPWTTKESEDAQNAIRVGVDEMLELYAKRPTAVTNLWDDAVESLIDVTYSGGTGSADIDEAARAGAYRNLEILIAPYLDRDPRSAVCTDFGTLLPIAIYAHRFYPATDVRTAKIASFANAAYRQCASFSQAVGRHYRGMLANRTLSREGAFRLVIWSIQLNEAELVPGLKLPPEARDFSPRLWLYLEDYPMLGAEAYSDGARNEAFIQTAYLATHMAFIPTGYHRYPIYAEDSPKLYRFLRENFYPLLDAGQVDLAAQFVDALRQYGCSEEDDRQVRDGTRFLLQTFHEANDRWMNYREPGEREAVFDDYDFIHKPWSATIGLRHRTPEPAAPGTYGGVVRQWLPGPDEPNSY